MHRLVPALIEEMGEAYPELERGRSMLEATFLQEEESFRRTLGRGTALLDAAVKDLKTGDVLDGETAFKLYDTYGFPLDLTQDAVRARGLSVDTDGFDAAMEKQKEMARANWSGSGDAGTDAIWKDLRDSHGATEFTGYDDLTLKGDVTALIQNGSLVDNASGGELILLTSATPFYAESGGQAGDRGEIRFSGGGILTVTDVQKRAGDLHVHIGTLKGEAASSEAIELSVDAANRERTKHNHSATHIMHEALRRVLGDHVTQKGQMVDGERIRFDISHGGAITREELAKVEDQVNAVIQQNEPASTQLMEPEAAIAAGAMALFGEKYGDEVRVLALGQPVEGEEKAFSVELCGLSLIHISEPTRPY